MIVKNVMLWFPRLDPTRPDARFNKDRPEWSVQIRTENMEEKKAWEALGLKVKSIVPDEGKPYFISNLRKKSKRANGEESEPPNVVDGSLKAVDPKTIGNGSRANVKVYQYEYETTSGKKGYANVLMAIQLIKHIVYTPKPGEDFDLQETEVIEEDDDVIS